MYVCVYIYIYIKPWTIILKGASSCVHCFSSYFLSLLRKTGLVIILDTTTIAWVVVVVLKEAEPICCWSLLASLWTTYQVSLFILSIFFLPKAWLGAAAKKPAQLNQAVGHEPPSPLPKGIERKKNPPMYANKRGGLT